MEIQTNVKVLLDSRAILFVLAVISLLPSVAGIRSIVSASGVADSRRPICIESSGGKFDSRPNGLIIVLR